MSDLGFGGAAGVGRPFTIQDLFTAVSGQATTTASNSSTVTVINQYLTVDTEDVSVVDSYVATASAPIGYDMGIWQDGSWT